MTAPTLTTHPAAETASGPRFTTAQISRATGISKPAVAAALKRVQPDGEELIRGQRARSWSIPTLPAELQQRLQSTARETGYRDAEMLLQRAGKPVAKPMAPRPLPAQADPLYRELRGRIASFDSRALPTATQLELLWADILEFHDTQIPASKRPKKAKRKLLEFLLAEAPFLAKNFHALQEKFRCRVARWQAEGRTPAALEDRRKHLAGPAPKAEPTEEDLKWLKAYAVKFGGGMNQGWREALRDNRFSPGLVAAYGLHRVIPHRLREMIAPDVETLKIHDHGPHAARTYGAYINRDPNGIASGDWDQSDDLTLPVQWYDPLPTSPFFGQGQFIPWMDERSWFWYGFVLVSDPAYNGFYLRNSYTKKLATYGLPREGLHVERGIWENAKIFAGKHPSVDPEETEKGLRGLGLRIHHATHARGKLIERVFGVLQNSMQTCRGYVGRNAHTDKYEQVQKHIRRVKAGEDPAKYFLSKLEMMEFLEDLMERFNNTPLFGKYHKGLTPKEAYQKHFTTPLIRVPDESRWVLASNRIVRTVSKNGIEFHFGDCHFVYRHERTPALFRRQVVAWFNPESPDLLPVSDLDGKFMFIATLAKAIAGHDAPPGELEKASAECALHNKYYKAMYRDLKPKFSEAFEHKRFRQNIVSKKTVEVQEKLDAVREEAAERRRAQTVQDNELTRLATELNIDPATLNPDTGEALEALRAKKKILAARAASQAEQPTIGE